MPMVIQLFILKTYYSVTTVKLPGMVCTQLMNSQVTRHITHHLWLLP